VTPRPTCYTRRVSAESSEAPADARRARWYHDVRWLLVLIFFVLGPLAIPLVWRSPTLSRRSKITLTAVAIAYALATLGGILEIASRALDMLHDAGIDVSLR
jgi:hypothetical protein